MRKRVLYIHHGRGIGGAPLSLLYLVRRLDPKLYEAIIVCLHDSAAADLYRKEGLKTIAGLKVTRFAHTTLNWYHWYEFHKMAWAFWLQIKTVLFIAPRLYRQYQPDLVHLNTTTLLGWGIAAKFMKIPVICHVREPLANGYFGLRLSLIKYITHWFTSEFISICHYDASKLVQSKKINVVYNFVDFKHFNRLLIGEQVRKKLEINLEAKIVLYLGGKSKVKGLLELLQSAEMFLKENRYLIIAGSMWRSSSSFKRRLFILLKLLKVKTYHMQVEDQLEKLKKLNLSHLIITLGIRDDIPELLATCNVLVFPAIVPHFARPVIEAAAMAKPSIASALGGVMELIDDGITGSLVQSSDPEQLGEAIIWHLSNPMKSATMGENAYYKAKNLFDDKRNCEKIFDIYERILSSHKCRDI